MSESHQVSGPADPPYKDPLLPISERVEDLLGRLTLEEKGQQLDMLDRSWGQAEAYLRDGMFDHHLAAQNISQEGQGSLSQRSDAASPRAYAESSNEVQRFLAEHTRLGIPALFIGETLHGVVGPIGGTVFPQAIGLGATWNPDLIERVGAVIAAEARAVGTHVGLSPVLDVCRDPRWGRLEESYGEDPHLVARLGVAMVQGMQKDGELISTVKHFAGHGAPQGGRDSAPVGYGRAFLRQFALPPFESAVREAGVRSVMAAYSDWCYVPCNASKELLTETLRDEWGFEGFVIEDMGAISLLHRSHSVAADPASAAALAISAGVDQSFASPFGSLVVDQVTAGGLDESTVDMAVRRILHAKFELGLFEDPYVDPNHADEICDSPDHRELAREAARQSIVLLKNDSGLLPLSKSLRSVAVIGPNADVAECGDYSGRNPNLVTPFDGIRAKVAAGTEVVYSKGCEVLGGELDELAVVHSKYLTPKGTGRGFAPQPGATGLYAEYFDNRDLAGEAHVTAVDPVVLFDWGGASFPGGSTKLGVTHFSVRWSGVLVPEVAGRYEVALKATDGVRLRLGDEEIIDSWKSGPAEVRVAETVLEAGEPVPIVVEHFSNSERPAIRMLWRRVSDDQDDAIGEATRTAAAADVAIVFVGGSGLTSGEIRDIGNLELTGRQMDLIRAVHATGTPTVLVHIGGRPNTMEWAFDNLPAVVAAWFPGEEGGNAIADVLFGDFNPSGRLPTQWPATTGQLPSTYDYMHTGRDERGHYVDEPIEPRFPFGYGLSYTRFEYGEVTVPDKVLAGDPVPVAVDVSNLGACPGVEVVQVYVRDVIASVKRPMRQLKGFQRVSLEPGETKKVTFELPPEHLQLWNDVDGWVLEPGEFKVMVGGNVEHTREARFKVEPLP